MYTTRHYNTHMWVSLPLPLPFSLPYIHAINLASLSVSLKINMWPSAYREVIISPLSLLLLLLRKFLLSYSHKKKSNHTLTSDCVCMCVCVCVCVCRPESQFCNEFVLEAAVQLHKNKVYFIIVLQMFNVCFLLLTLSLLSLLSVFSVSPSSLSLSLSLSVKMVESDTVNCNNKAWWSFFHRLMTSF